MPVSREEILQFIVGDVAELNVSHVGLVMRLVQEHGNIVAIMQHITPILAPAIKMLPDMQIMVSALEQEVWGYGNLPPVVKENILSHLVDIYTRDTKQMILDVIVLKQQGLTDKQVYDRALQLYAERDSAQDQIIAAMEGFNLSAILTFFQTEPEICSAIREAQVARLQVDALMFSMSLAGRREEASTRGARLLEDAGADKKDGNPPPPPSGPSV